MAGFKFRLQNLLGLKEKIEEQKREQYGQALQRLQDEVEKREEIANQIEVTYDQLKRNMNTTFVPRDTILYKRYLGLLNKNYKSQEQRIIREQQIVHSKREDVLEAMKERKMLESLKEKDYIEYQEEEKKSEQKLIDELVSFQYKNHQY